MKKWMVAIIALAALLPATVHAQNSDLAPVPASEAGYGTDVTPAAGAPPAEPVPPADGTAPPADAPPPVADAGATSPKAGCAPGPSVAGAGATYNKKDVLAAGEHVFGQGAEGLAK